MNHGRGAAPAATSGATAAAAPRPRPASRGRSTARAPASSRWRPPAPLPVAHPGSDDRAGVVDGQRRPGPNAAARERARDRRVERGTAPRALSRKTVPSATETVVLPGVQGRHRGGDGAPAADGRAHRDEEARSSSTRSARRATRRRSRPRCWPRCSRSRARRRGHDPEVHAGAQPGHREREQAMRPAAGRRQVGIAGAQTDGRAGDRPTAGEAIGKRQKAAPAGTSQRMRGISARRPESSQSHVRMSHQKN